MLDRAQQHWSFGMPRELCFDSLLLHEGGDTPNNHGLQLWPCGAVLARNLARRNLAGFTLLEIGAGLGVASIMAYRAGAKVTSVDSNPAVAERLRQHAWRNRAELEIVCADWKDVSGQFDFVIGSDVVYRPELIASAKELVSRVWTRKGSVIWVDANRQDNRARIAAAFPEARVCVVSGQVWDGQPYQCDFWEMG